MLNHDLGGLAEQLVAIANVLSALAVRLSRLQGFARPNCLEDVGLGQPCLVGGKTLRGKSGAARVAATGVPAHQALSVLARQIGSLRPRWFGFPRRDEQHVSI